MAVQEFYARCRASQELISAQIPWAFSQAERSRQAAGRKGQPNGVTRPSTDSHTPNRTDSQVSLSTISSTGELTQEEQLLAALLAANEDLMEALRLYDDLERVGMEREAEERSRKETRMDRSVRLPVTVADSLAQRFAYSTSVMKIWIVHTWNQEKHITLVHHHHVVHLLHPLHCLPRHLSSLRQ